VAQPPHAPHSASPSELKQRLEAEREGLPFLLYRDGAGAQQVLTLAPAVERVSVGRRPEADLALTWDSEVSRLHAVLERVAGEWTVVDDGLSANGTWAGADRISGRRRLVEGDVLRFGRTLVTFRDPMDQGDGATSRGADLAVLARISPAQRQVLVALCRPFAGGAAIASPATNQEIADALFLSVDAVKTHLRLLFGKFGIEELPQNQKRMELVRRAMGSGLVTERDLRS
jgi:pSer/pThr/pTyr-binding forkhead associated (FHA) protein/DNA-binding CsgD family transcriptional regulator